MNESSNGLGTEKVKTGRAAGQIKQAFRPAAKLVRTTFSTSREMDFFSEKELVTQTGHKVGDWPLVILKELFVVHDFDKAGFEISQRLTTVSEWAEDNFRVTYEFQNDINVIDLGLRLMDVEEYGLTGERCKFSGYFAADSIATEKEEEFLRSGQRVELNEFTSPQFIEWLEAKLTRHLPNRLIPGDDVLAAAYRRALSIAGINRAIEEARDDAIEKAKAAEVPKTLRRQLAKLLKDSPYAWDKVLYDLAETAESKLSQEGDE